MAIAMLRGLVGAVSAAAAAHPAVSHFFAGSKKNAQQTGSRVQLDAGVHPLMVQEPKSVQTPDVGRALLQRRVGGESTAHTNPMGQLLERMPAMPALALADALAARWLPGNPFVATSTKVSPRGFQGQPQGPTFLPGGAELPKLPRKEELLAHPGAGNVVVTGKPTGHWDTRPEGFVSVGAKLSDLIHLSTNQRPLNLEVKDIPGGVTVDYPGVESTTSAHIETADGRKRFAVTHWDAGNMSLENSAHFVALGIQTKPELTGGLDEASFVASRRTVEGYDAGMNANDTETARAARVLLEQLGDGYEAVNFRYVNLDGVEGLPRLETQVRPRPLVRRRETNYYADRPLVVNKR